MQGLADGYFVLPYTIGNYLAGVPRKAVNASSPDFAKAEEEVKERTQRFLSIKGSRTVDSFHKELGKLLWDECGMARNAEGLNKALRRIPEIRDEFWGNVKVLGGNEELNQSLERAGRVADFLEFAELMCLDALTREESCGGHFRLEHQTEEGEALRNDKKFSHVAAWEHKGVGKKPVLHKEPLAFESIHVAQRSYK